MCDENGLLLGLEGERGAGWRYGRERGIGRRKGRKEAEAKVGAGAESVDELYV